jgi:hypothetical protein
MGIENSLPAILLGTNDVMVFNDTAQPLRPGLR